MSTLSAISGLVTCLCTEVERVTGEALCWCGVYPGGVPAWEHCGECSSGSCGMGYVTMTNASLCTTFGQPLNEEARCSTMLQATVAMGILRCIPINEDGSAPSVADMDVVAAQLIRDMEIMRYAATCCYKDPVILGGYEALPAMGGCVGGQWSVTLDVG